MTLTANEPWDIKRPKPYTVRGMKGKDCIRCGSPALHQWNICSDGNNYRPICLDCDIALNRLVLEWFSHPRAKELGDEYEAKQRALLADNPKT